jgi:hypothetical protein
MLIRTSYRLCLLGAQTIVNLHSSRQSMMASNSMEGVQASAIPNAIAERGLMHNSVVGYFGFILPSAIAVNVLIAALRERIGLCFFR